MQVNIALLTVTDTRTIETDKSGSILVKKIKEQNHKLIDRKIVKDEKNKIKKILSEWIKTDNIDVIITSILSFFIHSDKIFFISFFSSFTIFLSINL